MQPLPIEQLPKNNTGSKYLTAGDEIAYNDTNYKVKGHLKQGRLQMEDQGTGKNFILSKNDALYGSLLDAKQHYSKQANTTAEKAISVTTDTEPVASYGVRR